jgi:hypothetical protein
MNEIFISLGLNCYSAVYGVNNKLRKTKENGYKTCPFDLMLSSYKGVVECLKNDFEYFVDPKYLKLVPNLENPSELVIVNTKYNSKYKI